MVGSRVDLVELSTQLLIDSVWWKYNAVCAVTKHADSFPLRDQDSEGCERWLGTVYGNIHTGMTHGR